MRITKKFAGSNGIGKQIFSPTIETEKTLEVRRTLEREIEELEKRFFKRIDYSLTQPPLIGQRRSFPSEAITNGYRVALPMDDEDSFPLDYAGLLSFYSSRKVAATAPSGGNGTSLPSLPAVASDNIATIPRTLSQTNFNAKPSSTIVKQPPKPEPGYIDEAYRVHGFEVIKKEPVRRMPPSPKEAIPALPVTFQREKEKEKVYVNKKYHVAKTEFKQALPNGHGVINHGTITVDPSIDLHASALLLDFFRAARDKEYSEDSDSNGKRGGVYIDNNYRVCQASSQPFKRLKTT